MTPQPYPTVGQLRRLLTTVGRVPGHAPATVTTTRRHVHHMLSAIDEPGDTVCDPAAVEGLWQRFTDSTAAQGLSEQTLRQYRGDLRRAVRIYHLATATPTAGPAPEAQQLGPPVPAHIPLEPLPAAVQQQLQLLAAAWQVNPAVAVLRLIEFFYRSDAAAAHNSGGRHNAAPVWIHCQYSGARVDAEYDPATHMVTVLSGPLAGHRFTSPGAATGAVIGSLNDTDRTPDRSGWTFWKINSSGADLGTLR